MRNNHGFRIKALLSSHLDRINKRTWLFIVGDVLLAISLLGFYFYPKILDAKYAGCDGPTNPLPCFLTPTETIMFQVIAYLSIAGLGSLMLWFVVNIKQKVEGSS